MEILDQPVNPYDPVQLPNASEGNRIVAYIIDALIIGALFLVPIAGWIAGIAYFLTRDALPFLDGQSVGKKAMNLRAVTENGEPLTNNWSASLLRNVVFFIPLFGIIELIVYLTNDKRQRLGDQWAKTRVVSTR